MLFIYPEIRRHFSRKDTSPYGPILLALVLIRIVLMPLPQAQSAEKLYPFDVPKPDVKYVNGGAEEYARATRSSIRSLVSKAMAKPGCQ